MTLFEKAVIFATQCHEGMLRKFDVKQYILHPLEVAVITGNLTNDDEVLAAAVLHDTVEDTPATLENIREEFGERVIIFSVSNLTPAGFRPVFGDQYSARRFAISAFSSGARSEILPVII